ncbi:hypothetical protein CC86DRAFT_374338 [Ophiobolus disseminans]|uniref:Uncharacterized protein n=1 Tax=Ophiobolus disseminans TaxID=1469910 RepID=A0A6A6ZJ15_9PLEO|nr:hypothetical protein CC86DRAFT_374338 [Ophiobolus disseminans]
MFRGALQAARCRTQRASRTSLQRFPSPSPPRPLSTDSTTYGSGRAKQAVDEFRAAQVFDSGTFATWRRSEYPTGDRAATRTEQLVWLAKQSLAASVSCTKEASSTTTPTNNTASQDKLRPICSWDGPTVWAHLW